MDGEGEGGGGGGEGRQICSPQNMQFESCKSSRPRHVLYFFVSHPMYCLRPCSFSFSLPGQTSEPGSLTRLFSPSAHYDHYDARLNVYLQKIVALSCFVDSRRLGPECGGG